MRSFAFFVAVAVVIRLRHLFCRSQIAAFGFVSRQPWHRTSRQTLEVQMNRETIISLRTRRSSRRAWIPRNSALGVNCSTLAVDDRLKKKNGELGVLVSWRLN